MHIHALQTGSSLVKSAFLGSPERTGGLVPFVANQFLDRARVRLPVFAWAIEHPDGVIVVDTGENATTPGTFLMQTRHEVTSDEEIGTLLTRLGIRRDRIAKVVLTHLHGDHIDGLRDFEGVPILVSQAEYATTQAPGARLIARAIGLHFPAWLQFTPIQFMPERIGPFDASFPLTRDGTVIAVPTPGHTAGHLAVIVIADGIHYFFAGDLTFSERSLVDQWIEGPSTDPTTHHETLKRVLAYTQQYPTVYLPAHDPEGPSRLAAHQIVPQQVSAHVQAN